MSSPRSFLDTTETVRFRNATYRARALFLLAAGGLVIAAHGVDVVNAGGPNWRALGIRLAWCALLVAQAATLMTLGG